MCETAVQAAMCPLEILVQMQRCITHQVASTFLKMCDTQLSMILRYTATGIVFLHNTQSVLNAIIKALSLMDQCYPMFSDGPSLLSPFSSVHRVLVESAVGILSDDASDDNLKIITSSFSTILRLFCNCNGITRTGYQRTHGDVCSKSCCKLRDPGLSSCY